MGHLLCQDESNFPIHTKIVLSETRSETRIRPPLVGGFFMSVLVLDLLRTIVEATLYIYI